MDVTLTQETPIKVKADVVVPWEKVDAHYQDSIKTIAKTVQLPGFRKGKAPVALLKKRFHDHILGEVAQKVVPDVLDECMKENDYRPVGTPRLSHLEMKDREMLSFVAEVHVLPKIELQEWRGIEVEKLKVEVKPEMIDQELERLREEATKTEDITDRAVEDGDRVTLGVTAMDEAGTVISDHPDYELALDQDDAHPVLSKAVIGMSIDEDKEIVFDAAEDDPFEDWRGKKIKAYIDVLAIKHVHTPSLGEAFAKEKGAASLADYRKEIEANLAESMAQQEEYRLQSELLQKMLAGYDFDVPPELVYAQAESQVRQYITPYMSYLKNQDQRSQRKFFEQMIEMSIPQAKAKIRTDLVLDEIVNALEIKVDEEELDEELEKIKSYYNAKSVQSLREQLTEKDSLEPIREALARQKAVKQIQDAAKITLVDELTTPEGEAEPAPSEEPRVEAELVETETDADNEKSPVE